ncbi:MAG: hypothetical protein EAZ20_13515 [Bacteroidetes bacterium]|nr:MAG: hypothetical protein EAZ20_13515 [Bacteroidota bacterium]
MKINILNNLLTAGIIVFFALLSIVYCYPMLEGKKLMQNDVLQSKGVAQETIKELEKTGERPLWTNSLFSGMPAFLVSMDYPKSLTTQLGRIFVNLIPSPANLLFLYFLGAYLMFLMLGYKLLPSILGAIGFALGSYNIINIEAGHVSKVWALGLTPPLIGAVVMAYRGKWLLGGALAGLFAGLQLYANHVQITYYVGIILFIYAFYVFIEKIIKKENLKPFFLATFSLILAGGLAIGSHASRLWTNYEYAKYTNRGKSELAETKKEDKNNTKTDADKEYAFQWSYGIGESFTFLVPNFVGGGSGVGKELSDNSNVVKVLQEYQINPEYKSAMPTYWGDMPFTSGPAYIGAIIVFLMVFALLISKESLKWWLLGIIIFCMLLSWGKNFSSFNYLMFDFFPLYSKFRAHTMVLSLMQIFSVWLAVLGVEELLKNDIDTKKIINALKISTGSVAGLCLLIALLGGSFMDFKPSSVKTKTNDGQEIRTSPDDEFRENLIKQFGNNQQAKDAANTILGAVRRDRVTLQSNDALRSFIFIFLSASLIWVAFWQKFDMNYAIAGVTLLALIDLWAIDQRYLNKESFKDNTEFESAFEPNDVDKQIKADKDLHYRIYNVAKNPFNDGITSYNHKHIGGYHAAKLRRYQDVIENHLGQGNIGVINMLNTKYIMQGNEKGELVAQKNPTASGNAWFVPKYELVKNADEELKKLSKIDAKNIAFIDKKFENQLKDLKNDFDSSATIRLTKYFPDKMEYESQSKNTQLAIFSEIYYVDKDKVEWKAFIDGKEIPHLRANYILRGLVIPAGKHKIEFKFDVPIYRTGENISLICSILLLLLVGFAAVIESEVLKKKVN